MEIVEFIKLIHFEVEYKEGEFPYLLARVVCGEDGTEVRIHMSSVWLKAKGKWAVSSKDNFEKYNGDAQLRKFIENLVHVLYLQKKIFTDDGKNDFYAEDYFGKESQERLDRISSRLENLRRDRKVEKVHG